MFKNLLFKTTKPLVLGRWSTGTSKEIIERRIAMAHCDNCGTCTVPENTTREKISIKPMVILEDDVIDLGYAPGSFDLHRIK